MTGVGVRALGTPLTRVEAAAKVTGAARYAADHAPEDLAHGWIVGARAARGTITGIDAVAALAAPGVIAVMTHENAPPLEPVEDGELAVLQSPAIAYRGQVVALVIAERLEAAREAASLVRVACEERPPSLRLSAEEPGLRRPTPVEGDPPVETFVGAFEPAFAAAAVRLDRTYTTPAHHNNPMEPHATVAVWHGRNLTLYDSTQGAPSARDALAEVLGLAPERVRVISEHVGGGFGSKGTPRPNLVLAAIAAQATGRPVRVAVTRQQMFDVTGYRTPTIQRMRVGASADGRLEAIAHDAVEQTSTVRDFAELSALPTRVMYAAPHRRTTHRLATLDVASPSWMRAPGECPGMFALECAMDELATACGIDPIELRIRNEPAVHPEEGTPFSSRNLVACLREGAVRFGWDARDPVPGAHRRRRRLLGTGVAASTYPAYRDAAQATARALPGGGFVVAIGAADIGTGARTVLCQVAADALGVPVTAVELRLGDSALPPAPVAGGSAGTASWGTAVHGACRALAEALEAGGGERGPDGLERAYDTAADLEAQAALARHAFGAQFAEVEVDVDSGEVRVTRLLGVFAAGRIMNPRTARSQLAGGMTMGAAMALLEEGRLDRRFGDVVNRDLAQYHVPVAADLPLLDIRWIEEDDPNLNPMGAKGIGEIGIVGTAAAVANAVHHATGIRFRDLPLHPDRVLAALSAATSGLDE